MNEMEDRRGGSESPDVLFLCYYYITFLVITLVNLCGNSLILVSVRRTKLRVPENYCIFSLATSDLIHGVVYTVYNISHMNVPAIRAMISK